jgi:RNA polymerase sigma-70 factor (ECF subfamily)
MLAVRSAAGVALEGICMEATAKRQRPIPAPTKAAIRIAEAYSTVLAVHGCLDLEEDVFASRIWAITRKYLEPDSSDTEIAEFISCLHAADLYLAAACAQNSEGAWRRFDAVFRKDLNHVCCHLGYGVFPELVQTLWSDLFLPDRSGQSRIASYDGRSSLGTWLHVIVTHRVINELKRKSNAVQRLICLPEVVDHRALSSVEARPHSSRYETTVKKCLEAACKTLTSQEKSILLSRYDEGLRLGEIARLLHVHQSTVTRQLDRILKKLGDEVRTRLSKDYGFKKTEIDECLATVAEHLESISIISLIKHMTV